MTTGTATLAGTRLGDSTFSPESTVPGQTAAMASCHLDPGVWSPLPVTTARTAESLEYTYQRSVAQ